MGKFFMNVEKIHLSQLYLSEHKLKTLLANGFNPKEFQTNEPLPVKKIKDTIFFTDGHHRAYLYYTSNIMEIPVYWDEDELDIDCYNICLNWCKEEEINFIADLENRVLKSHDDFLELWVNRCQREFAKKS